MQKMTRDEALSLLRKGEDGIKEWNGRMSEWWGQVDLSDADLSGLKLQNVDLRGLNLSRAILIQADLSHANLPGVNLSGARLRNAQLQHTILSGADLSGADFAEATLYEADLGWTKCRGCSFAGAYLGHARFAKADLTECDFDNAEVSLLDIQGLSGLPIPPKRLRISGPDDEDITLTGHETETFFLATAVVEVFLTHPLNEQEVGAYYFHLAEMRDRRCCVGVFLAGHRHEAGGSVFRFQATSHEAIYAALPDLLTPFRRAAAIDWEATVASIPAANRPDAIETLVKIERRQSHGKWRIAERLAEAFGNFRNARVIQIRDGRHRGIRIDVFTSKPVASLLTHAAGDHHSSAPLLLMAVDQSTRGDTITVEGNAVGSAIGAAATVTAEQVIAGLQESIESAPLSREVKERVLAVLASRGVNSSTVGHKSGSSI